MIAIMTNTQTLIVDLFPGQGASITAAVRYLGLYVENIVRSVLIYFLSDRTTSCDASWARSPLV